MELIENELHSVRVAERCLEAARAVSSKQVIATPAGMLVHCWTRRAAAAGLLQGQQEQQLGRAAAGDSLALNPRRKLLTGAEAAAAEAAAEAAAAAAAAAVGAAAAAGAAAAVTFLGFLKGDKKGGLLTPERSVFSGLPAPSHISLSVVRPRTGSMTLVLVTVAPVDLDEELGSPYSEPHHCGRRIEVMVSPFPVAKVLRGYAPLPCLCRPRTYLRAPHPPQTRLLIITSITRQLGAPPWRRVNYSNIINATVVHSTHVLGRPDFSFKILVAVPLCTCVLLCTRFNYLACS